MIVTVICCQHCGEYHTDVRFEPTGDGRYWSICPKLGGVIWLRVSFGTPKPGPSETKGMDKKPEM